MITCRECKKPLNQEADVSVFCLDCTRNVIDSNKCNFESIRNRMKRENLIVIIFAIIGAIGGIILGIVGGIEAEDVIERFLVIPAASIWMIGGFATGLGYLISGFIAIGYKRWGLGLFFPIIGIFTGAILFLLIISRRVFWIKKFNEIITSENKAESELEEYIAGNKIDREELYAKLLIITVNFNIFNDLEITSSGVPLANLRELKPAYAHLAKII